MSTIKRQYKMGGKVIASGGFGCVFSPALKCQGKLTRDKNKISKLMTEKHALQEYNDIQEFKKKLDTIPNYTSYFLLNDFTICKPDNLTKEDLTNFKSKCSALPKNSITHKNINKSLNNVLALNMPNGGIPVDDYIFKNNSYEYIIKLNNKLIQLLNNGILPMNKKNIYHCDIKDSNILVDDSENKLETRLIDWGLSTEYVPNMEYTFPKTWRNRPLQFNVPFSVIIFTDVFIEKYTKYLNDGGKTDHVSLKPFVLNYIYFWIQKRGAGHYKYINNIMYMLFSSKLTNVTDEKMKVKLIESDFTLFYISNYIIEILKNFTEFRKNGTLNLRVYLDTVFIKIVDIWGFVVTYLPILEILFENYAKLNTVEHKLFESLKHIFINYLFNPRIKPINIKDLTDDLKNLNTIIQITNNTSTATSNRSSLQTSSIKRTKSVSTQNLRSILNKTSKKRNKGLLLLSSTGKNKNKNKNKLSSKNKTKSSSSKNKISNILDFEEK
jgi:hypothetical protein